MAAGTAIGSKCWTGDSGGTEFVRTMGRYVPKTYNNRRILRIIYRLIITIALAAVILFILLFFGLRQYEVHTEDGIRLEIPLLMDDPPAEEGARSAMLGFILGVATGAAQLRLFSRVKAAAADSMADRKAVAILAAQLLIPLVLMVVAALLLYGDLLWSGIGLVVSIAGISFFRFIRSGRKR